jgi:hypothetical protein
VEGRTDIFVHQWAHGMFPQVQSDVGRSLGYINIAEKRNRRKQFGRVVFWWRKIQIYVRFRKCSVGNRGYPLLRGYWKPHQTYSIALVAHLPFKVRFAFAFDQINPCRALQ